MPSVALLNEPTDAEVSKKMLQMVRDRLQNSEADLIHRLLDHDSYLSAFARAKVLRDIEAELAREYQKAFET